MRPAPARLLARRVEAAAPEDEHGDEHEERQPLRLRCPRQAPQHGPLPVVQLAQHECEVQRAGNTADVDRDERRDAHEPPRERARLDRRRKHPRAADVLRRAYCIRRLHVTLRFDADKRLGRHEKRDCTRLGLAPRAHAQRRPPPRPRHRAAAARRPAPRAGGHSRVLHRQGRRFRADIPRDRHVRVHPRPPICVHAAALRLVLDPALLDLRPPLGGRRARAHLRRRRDDTHRLADRQALAHAARSG